MAGRPADEVFGSAGEFFAVLTAAELNACKDWDIDFTNDMRERADKYGARTLVSQSQEEHLRRIADF